MIVFTALLLGAALGYALGANRAIPVPQPQTQTLDLNITDGGVYRVRKVVDGDTVMLENGLMVRYHGVNAPEVGRFVKDPAPLSGKATERNIALVEGKRVRLRLAREPLDIHGRIVARVLVQPDDPNCAAPEADAGALLITEGLARASGLSLTAEENRAMKALEDQARRDKVGIWSLETENTATRKPYCAASGSETRVYHAAACAIAGRIKAENRHEYGSPQEAEAAGLRPCDKCLAK